MAEIIKKGDFIEIEYTGIIPDSGIIFDTTDESIAKKNSIYSKEMQYGPVVICIGEAQIIKGLDSNLEGKEIGRKYDLKLDPENAFGKKDASMLKLVPLTIFRKQNINPFPGLQVNIDGMMGTVKISSGGRVIVDFNHPLSGKQISYEVNVKRKVTDKSEQVRHFLMLKLNLKPEAFKASISEDTAVLEFKQELPKEVKDIITQSILKVIQLKKVEFIIMKEAPKKEEKKEEQQKKNA